MYTTIATVFFSKLQTRHACGKTLSLECEQEKTEKEVVVRSEEDGFYCPSAILMISTKCSRNAVRFRILTNKNVCRACTYDVLSTKYVYA